MANVKLSPSANSGDWLGGANGYAEDAVYAQADAINEAHIYYNYGFTLLSTDTVNGITVSGLGNVYADTTINGDYATISIYLSINAGVSYTAAIAKDWLSNEGDSTHIHGGATNIWGLSSPTGDQFSDANFRCKIVWTAKSGDADVVKLDWIPVTIYYTSASASVVVNNAIFFAGD